MPSAMSSPREPVEIDRHVFDNAALAELHDRAFAELFLDLTYREVDCLFPIYIHCLPPNRLTGR